MFHLTQLSNNDYNIIGLHSVLISEKKCKLGKPQTFHKAKINIFFGMERPLPITKGEELVELNFCSKKC